MKKILAESQKEYAHLKSEMGVTRMGAHNTVDPELGVFMARKYFNLKAQVEKLGDQIFSIKQKIERLIPKNDKNIN